MDFIEKHTRLAVFRSNVATVVLDEVLMQVRLLSTPKRTLEVAMVVVWFQSYWVDPYSPTKITENKEHLGNRPDWAVFGSDVATESLDGVLMQESRIDPICKKIARTVRKFDPIGQSGCFFVVG
ncbi:hypothetical protein CRG98_031344 [Punica granatum]|uniref:Uncharacterized protein n=1 Tax=Punica granatum TaxID=22663 RepID=A0A2I0IW66_PUNGR|nr:hypothetical protein CRG98_031344 [Punica granatum]